MSLESLPSSDPSSDTLNRDRQHVGDEVGGSRKLCFDICNWSAEFCRSERLFTIHHHVFALQVPACCLLCYLPPSQWTLFISSTLLLKNTLGCRQEERSLKQWAEQRWEFTDLQSSVYQCALSLRQLMWWQYRGIAPKSFYMTHCSLVNSRSSWGGLINWRSRRQRNNETWRVGLFLIWTCKDTYKKKKRLLEVADLQWLKSSQNVNRKLLFFLQFVSTELVISIHCLVAEFQHRDIRACQLSILKTLVCARARTGLSRTLPLWSSCLHPHWFRPPDHNWKPIQVIQWSSCQREHLPLSPFPGGCDNIT